MSDAMLQILDALAQGLARETRAFEEARVRLATQVQGELDELAEVRDLMFDDDLPVRPATFRPVSLFPLGGFRHIWLEQLSGRSMLYLGEDCRLYEYAPAALSTGDLDSPVHENTMRLQPVNMGTLKYHELMVARDLIRRLWI